MYLPDQLGQIVGRCLLQELLSCLQLILITRRGFLQNLYKLISSLRVHYGLLD